MAYSVTVFYTDIDDLSEEKTKKKKKLNICKDWYKHIKLELIESEFMKTVDSDYLTTHKIVVDKIFMNHCYWYSDTWKSNRNSLEVTPYIDICDNDSKTINIGLHNIDNEDIINWFRLLDEFYYNKNNTKYFTIPKYFDKLLEKLPFVKMYDIEIRRG